MSDDVKFSTKLPSDLHEALVRQARLNARSVSAEAALRLRMSLAGAGGVGPSRDSVVDTATNALAARAEDVPAARPPAAASGPSDTPVVDGVVATLAATPKAKPAPRGAPPGNPPWYPTSDDLSKPRARIVKSAADLAAELGATLGSDVPARDFSKGKQAGRAKT